MGDLQIEYSLLSRGIEDAILPCCQELGIGITAYGVLSRGLLNHAVTRLYFADEPTNASDPVLERVPAERRGTLLAELEPGPGPAVYHFDIVLQGDGETAFFNL